MKNEKLEKLIKEYESEEKFKQLDNGMKNLLHTYYCSKNANNIAGMLIINDIIWDNELESFVKGLKENDVKELVFASTWSSAIQVLMYLIENGYQVAGTIEYYKDEFLGKTEIRKGIKLVLK